MGKLFKSSIFIVLMSFSSSSFGIMDDLPLLYHIPMNLGHQAVKKNISVGGCSEITSAPCYNSFKRSFVECEGLEKNLTKVEYRTFEDKIYEMKFYFREENTKLKCSKAAFEKLHQEYGEADVIQRLPGYYKNGGKFVLKWRGPTQNITAHANGEKCLSKISYDSPTIEREYQLKLKKSCPKK